MKTKGKYMVFPRFTEGDVEVVDWDGVLQVIAAEQAYIDKALKGKLGAAACSRVKLQGSRFIAILMESSKGGWKINDLMDYSRHLWPHRAKCHRCGTSKLKCQYGCLEDHTKPDGTPCDHSGHYVGRELEADLVTAAETYGAQPPTRNADVVLQALGQATTYRNQFTAIERTRRQQEDTVLGAVGDVAAVTAQIDALKDELKMLRDRMKKAKSGKTKAERKKPDPADVQRAKNLKELLKPLYASAKEIRVHARSTVVREQIQAIRAEAKTSILAARANRAVYWGTGAVVEASAEQSFKTTKKGLPKFVSAKGQGTVAVQLQGGVPWRDLFGTTNTLARIDPLPDTAWDGSRSERRRTCQTVIHLRVASEKRKPVWASFPMWMHRPLPEGARVKWIKVIRRRDGHRFSWSVNISYDTPRDSILHDDVPDNRAERVGIDVGWRAFKETVTGISPAEYPRAGDKKYAEDEKLTAAEGCVYSRACRLADMGHNDEAFKLVESNPRALKRLRARNCGPHTIRVACWHGSDGQSGEVKLDAGYSRMRALMERLESNMKTNFNECVPRLVAWFEKNPVPQSFLHAVKPLFRTKSDRTDRAKPFTQQVLVNRLKQWEAPSRLHALRDLWFYWEMNNDDEVWQTLDAWHHQDKHLVDWLRGLKRKAEGRRREQYRLFAAEIARKYKYIIVEDFPLPEVIEKPQIEEEVEHRNKEAEKNRRTAGVSVLRDALKNAARTCAAEYIAVDAKNTTRQCAQCGSIETWDQAKYVMHLCKGCGACWDQDHNAAQVIGERGHAQTN